MASASAFGRLTFFAGLLRGVKGEVRGLGGRDGNNR
jgi:hypothetical protein